MSKSFLDENFYLNSKSAEILYNDYAKSMPIYDYHCHLPIKEISENIKFKNITQLWLSHDHMKWRAMRTCGIEEKYCTGDADDFEKFQKWAYTVPQLVRNPLYVWTHLELKRFFNIDKLLSPANSKEIYDEINEKLKSDDFSTKSLMKKMDVKLVCTTDDPNDSLEFHKKISDDKFEIKVLPTFRADKALAIDNSEVFNNWVNVLEAITDIEIENYKKFLDAFRKRHDYFHKIGCRISDNSLDTAYADDFTYHEVFEIFNKARNYDILSEAEVNKFRSAIMYELALLNHEKGWVQQLHFGALRNNSTRLFEKTGPDTGGDSMGDKPLAYSLSKFLNKLDRDNKLTKTIIYNLHPMHNEMIAAMCGNFQDGSSEGKIQFGSAWWFVDQKDGIENQINILSQIGLISKFIGMLTDSRSFISYTRHEYFRRILCNLFGQDIENGYLPKDYNFLGGIIQDICFNNAKKYFPIDL